MGAPKRLDRDEKSLPTAQQALHIDLQGGLSSFSYESMGNARLAMGDVSLIKDILDHINSRLTTL